jgi:hypothetical protein
MAVAHNRLRVIAGQERDRGRHYAWFGGTFINGQILGFGKIGVPGTGFFNMGSDVPGLFGLTQRLAG